MKAIKRRKRKDNLNSGKIKLTKREGKYKKKTKFAKKETVQFIQKRKIKEKVGLRVHGGKKYKRVQMMPS